MFASFYFFGAEQKSRKRSIHFPPTMHATPIATNGMLSSCPMSSGSEASNASCTSLVYSMKSVR